MDEEEFNIFMDKYSAVSNKPYCHCQWIFIYKVDRLISKRMKIKWKIMIQQLKEMEK